MRWQRIETHVYIYIYIYVCVCIGDIDIYVYIYIVHTYIYREDIGLYRGTRKEHGKYHLGLSDMIPQYCWDQPERKGVL